MTLLDAGPQFPHLNPKAFSSDRVGANEEILDVANGLCQQEKNNCLVIRTVTIAS